MNGVEILAADLSPADYVRHRRELGDKIGHRTVQRYLPLGRIEGAWQDDGGRWHVPADARVLPAGGTVAVRRATVDAAPPAPDVRPASPFGMLVPLEDAAAALGTTVGGVRRLADGGHLVLGPFGPHGSLRVWVPAP